MEIEGKVGPRPNSDGAKDVIRLGESAEVITSLAHAKYYESTFRGKVYNGAIAGQTTTVGLATTYTGLCLSNPNNSGVNLVITQVGYAFSVAFADPCVIGLATGYSTTNVTHTAAVTPRNQYFGGNSGGSGLLDSSATLPVAPTLNTILDIGTTAAVTTSPKGSGGFVDLNGSIILKPGAYCIFYTSTASGSSGGYFSYTWEEVQII